MIIFDVLLALSIQMLFTVGAALLFGLAIGFLRKRFYANFGPHGLTVCKITGILGTPLHELSHAFMCVLFGHRIVEIKLFDLDSENGTLGYVKHTYNRKNIYCNIGNFFIGIAPILCISALLFLFAYFLLPGFTAAAQSLDFSLEEKSTIVVGLCRLITEFFSAAVGWRWWVFILASMPFVMHMAMSRADLNGALSGSVFLLTAFFIVDLILGLISMSLLDAFTGVMLSLGCYLICILTIGLIVTFIAFVLSLLYKKIVRRR